MTDNRQIKDGLGNLFTVRMRDFSALSDGSVQRSMILATPYPLDYGAGGSFSHRALAPELPAAPALATAPIYAWQWPAATPAIIARVRVSAWATGTPFSVGPGWFSLHVARVFTAQATGGNVVSLAGNVNKLATAMASSASSIAYANGVPLTPGTWTLDPDPLDSAFYFAPTVADTMFTATPMVLLDKRNGEQPLILERNEGFVVTVTLPPAGSWQFAVTTEWSEVLVF